MGVLGERRLQTDHLRRLTDETGILQHAEFGIPDRGKGYTSDDNARALIAAVMLYRLDGDPGSLDLMYTYVAFLRHAQQEDGNFRNVMGYDRRFVEETGSEDSFGRCLWALGVTLSEPSVPGNLKNSCRHMFDAALQHVRVLRSPRAQAYAIIGLSCVRLDTVNSLVAELASRLHMQYQQNRAKDWHWFEDSITYCNAMLPWSLLKASLLLDRADLKETATESLAFLVSATFSGDGYFKPIGCHGWLPRNGEAALFDEQPVEACETLLACQEAFTVLGDPTYLERASLCYEWYLGRNLQHASLLDPQSGGCYDGLHAGGVNLNQGAESIISFCIAHLAMNHE